MQIETLIFVDTQEVSYVPICVNISSQPTIWYEVLKKLSTITKALILKGFRVRS